MRRSPGAPNRRKDLAGLLNRLVRLAEHLGRNEANRLPSSECPLQSQTCSSNVHESPPRARSPRPASGTIQLGQIFPSIAGKTWQPHPLLPDPRHRAQRARDFGSSVPGGPRSRTRTRGGMGGANAGRAPARLNREADGNYLYHRYDTRS